jgi:hypothetical protein
MLNWLIFNDLEPKKQGMERRSAKSGVFSEI